MSVQSIDRAVDILSLFSETRPVLGITDISRAMHLPKPTIHGLVKTLANRGFLMRIGATRKYRLGFLSNELNGVLADTLPINQAGADLGQRLSQETSMAVRLAIWQKKTMLTTLTLLPNCDSSQFRYLGPNVPLYCTSLGKAIMAVMSKEEMDNYWIGFRFIGYTEHTLTTRKLLLKDLELTRRRGYSYDRGEYLADEAGIGAPIYDRTESHIGSICLSGSPGSFQKVNIEKYAAKLIEVSLGISHNLGYID